MSDSENLVRVPNPDKVNLSSHMKSYAEYQPQARGSVNERIEIIRAERRHIAGIAEMRVQRDGVDFQIVSQKLHATFDEMETHPDKHCVLAAEHFGGLVGFGRVGFIPTNSIGGAYGMPEGWYLTGTIVKPEYRRQGVGRRLCAERIKWISQFSNSAFYMANARNKPSIRLHEEFGFKEIGRKFGLPGLTFQGGEGVLFETRLDRSPNHWRNKGQV